MSGPLRQCLGLDGQDCSRLGPGNRCDEHARELELRRTRGKREQRPYTAPERQRRAEAVAAWRATHGDWCPGWGGRPAHPSVDLTADHVTAVAAGGREDGPLVVLCRSCNGSKGAR